MTVVFAAFLVIHGLIHVMGFAKAFGYADLPGLTVPISRGLGVAWLIAASLFVAAAVLVLTRPRIWWMVAALAVVLSMAVIVPSWRDARYGALANLVALTGVAFGVLAFGPTSLRAAYDRDVHDALRDDRRGRMVTEADLVALPPPVQHYLRRAGVVGQPMVTRFRARMHGRIRSAPDAAWMPFTAEQYNVFGPQPSRLFYMTARRAGVPIQGYHRFIGDSASMVVKAAALVPVVDMRGEVMTRSETVTLFNDMCVMAPATLLDARVRWPAGGTARDGDRTVVPATFTHLGRTVSARLSFDAEGRLIDFVSDDRSAAAADGHSARQLRWSTPLRDERAFGSARLMSAGAAHWHEQGVAWPYIELTLDEVAYIADGQ